MNTNILVNSLREECVLSIKSFVEEEGKQVLLLDVPKDKRRYQFLKRREYFGSNNLSELVGKNSWFPRLILGKKFRSDYKAGFVLYNDNYFLLDEYLGGQVFKTYVLQYLPADFEKFLAKKSEEAEAFWPVLKDNFLIYGASSSPFGSELMEFFWKECQVRFSDKRNILSLLLPMLRKISQEPMSDYLSSEQPSLPHCLAYLFLKSDPSSSLEIKAQEYFDIMYEYLCFAYQTDVLTFEDICECDVRELSLGDIREREVECYFYLTFLDAMTKAIDALSLD